ncbi:MAG TPA: hypothetical protein VKU82_15810 [Planctomycetaceae bacterium]|nr:hypothetical protein [Planctomycetaceae bacterium]
MRWMICVLMLAIAGVGWAVAASDYAVAEEDFAFGKENGPTSLSPRRMRGRIFGNAIDQIPNAGLVISHAFSKARWIVYVFGGLELGAVCFGFIGWRLQRSFDAEADHRHKRKR